MLEGEHETGEHEDGDADDDQNQAEILVRLVEGVHQALQTNKVTDHLENPKNSHDPEKDSKLLVDTVIDDINLMSLTIFPALPIISMSSRPSSKRAR